LIPQYGYLPSLSLLLLLLLLLLLTANGSIPGGSVLHCKTGQYNTVQYDKIQYNNTHHTKITYFSHSNPQFAKSQKLQKIAIIITTQKQVQPKVDESV
jgi:hypothetical protein